MGGKLFTWRFSEATWTTSAAGGIADHIAKNLKSASCSPPRQANTTGKPSGPHETTKSTSRGRNLKRGCTWQVHLNMSMIKLWGECFQMPK